MLKSLFLFFDLEAVKILEEVYAIFVDKKNIETEYNILAEHSIVGKYTH